MFRRSNQPGSSKAGGISSDAHAPPTSTGIPSSSSTSSVRSLGPQYSVPPFPHPLPDKCLSLHYTPDGLLILPSRRRAHQHGHHGKSAKEDIRTTSDAGPQEDVATDASVAVAYDALPQSAEEALGAGAKIAFARDAIPARTTTDEAKQMLNVQQGDPANLPSIYCYGIIGILRVFKAAYLLVITSRQPVGDFLRANQAIYKCTGVLAIPLTKEVAQQALATEAKRQSDGRRRAEEAALYLKDTDDESNSETSDDDQNERDDVDTPAVVGKSDNPFNAALGAAANLRALQARSEGAAARQYGAASKQGADDDKSIDSIDAPSPAQTFSSPSKTEKQRHQAAKAELEEKVVREAARQYARGEMWYSHDFDLTTPLQRKQEAQDSETGSSEGAQGGSRLSVNNRKMPFREPWSALPLWRRVDRRFWHNEHLSRDFAHAGLHNLVLPLMQGYVQIANLPLESRSPAPNAFDPAGDAMNDVSDAVDNVRTEAQLLIISRRSKERAGLRYQRRGVNDQGHVANFVETEQILFARQGEDSVHLQSFLQFRGSIPIRWRQDPFVMKPPPQLVGSAEENASAFAKHFEQQLPRYGEIVCINLAEQHGKEGAITNAYKQAAEGLANPNVRYKPFDFHEECKGMRFENVNKLIEDLKDNELAHMDCFWRHVDGSGTEIIYNRQRGAFRVSCLDCLDRTNVVQSAFARYILVLGLERLGVPISMDKSERDEAFDFAFNDAWANNGDMISQIYAGTKALKGDFTRTGKRNLMGMMNDATNSVFRMVRGAVSDFFKQTVIDFQYGHMSLAALEQYNHKLISQDPADVHRLSRVRAIAVDACARNIVQGDEEMLAGWTLFSPVELNIIQTPKLEEKVILLTSKSLYVCGYDFTSQKIAEFSRVLLGDITGIKRGMYILSPSEGHHPENHWGFILSYIKEERRLNTTSIRSKPERDSMSPGASNFVAFRAVVDDASSAEANMLASSRFLDSAERLQSRKQSHPDSSAQAPNLLARLKSGGRRAKGMPKAVEHDLPAAADRPTSQTPTSHDIIDAIVEAIVEQCVLCGACDEDDNEFVKEETIQSLAQAKATAPLFAPLIEGLKRRVWL